MVKLFIVLLFSLISSSYCQEADTSIINKKTISAEKWNSDITYLISRLEIMHPDLYANVSKRKFDNFIDTLLERGKTESDLNMAFGIMELFALIKDGHTKVDLSPSNGKNYLEEMNGYPIRLYHFSDGLFIISAFKQYKNLVGKRVIRIGNKTTEEALDLLFRIKSSDNYMGKKTVSALFKEILQYLKIINDTNDLALVIEDTNGKTEEIKIEPLPVYKFYPKLMNKVFPQSDSLIITMNEESKNPIPLWLSHKDEGFAGDLYWFQYLLSSNTVYVQINAMVNKSKESFEQFTDRLFKFFDGQRIEKMIIDIRNNSGGNHIELPLLKGIIARPALDKPDKLFLITGRRTFSAAQHFTTQFKRYTRATLFGEPTAGRPNHFGAIRWFQLPNSEITLSSSIDYIQDSEAYDFNITTEPDLFVSLSSDDYRNNRDAVLEQILKYDSYKDRRTEFAKKLVEAYNNGGMKNLRDICYFYKPEYIRSGFNLENLLFYEYNVWISKNAKSKEDIVEYKKFMNSELPNSINICYDLAEYLEKTGNLHGAKHYYNKCLELNPSHRYAKMRINLILLYEKLKMKYDN